jgi:hypothetical protein
MPYIIPALPFSVPTTKNPLLAEYLDYLTYNREERDLCAHLFRLLLEDQPDWRPLKEFLETDFNGSPRLYCEAALIRDAYYARKPDISGFMDGICEMIAEQEGIVGNYTKYSALEPEELRNPGKTHPKQLYYKLKNTGFQSKSGDSRVYGALQAMFNAKPDLVICIDNTLYIYEAKYHMTFDKLQLERTEKIGEVWAELLYRDLGFASKPKVEVRMLGLIKDKPKEGEFRYRFISWEEVLDIAKKHWNPSSKEWVATDYSIKVFSKLLKGNS